MTRSYATPLAFKSALEARIRERAHKSGRSVNRSRQLVVMDRFLVRVFERYDTALLKGGLVMELRLERARTTRDVDLRLAAPSNDILSQLQAAGHRDYGDYLTFEVLPHPARPTIEADGLLYEGRRFKVAARLAGKPYGNAFGVDVAIGEPIVGTPEPLLGDNLLQFIGLPRPRFFAYSVTTHIAEKLHAYTVPRSRPNSRVKDLPDIALLATVDALDSNALIQAIEKTFAHRNTHAIPSLLPPAPGGWEQAYARMASVEELPWSSLNQLVEATRAFLDPVLGGVSGQWDPTEWRWHNRTSNTTLTHR